MELQLLVEEYFVVRARFSFELSKDAKQNTGN